MSPRDSMGGVPFSLIARKSAPSQVTASGSLQGSSLSHQKELWQNQKSFATLSCRDWDCHWKNPTFCLPHWALNYSWRRFFFWLVQTCLRKPTSQNRTGAGELDGWCLILQSWMCSYVTRAPDGAKERSLRVPFRRQRRPWPSLSKTLRRLSRVATRNFWKTGGGWNCGGIFV